jgi:hypothetical protein
MQLTQIVYNHKSEDWIIVAKPLCPSSRNFMLSLKIAIKRELVKWEIGDIIN